ncbi:hypothetical protein ABDK09_13410 [Vibrio sp. CDRSL-10 TSBA]
MDYCGQCRQFSRVSGQEKDICSAWEQPTQAKRAACGFFMPLKTRRNQAAIPDVPKTTSS